MQKLVKKNSTGLLIGFLIITLLSSCGIYRTNLVDIPLISKKEDLKINGGLSFPSGSFYGTVTYGMTDKLAIQGFGAVSRDRIYLQAAVGLYHKRKGNQVLECYTGFGFGYGPIASPSSPSDLRGFDDPSRNFQLYFGQFNYGGQVGTGPVNVEMGGGIKIGYLHTNVASGTVLGVEMGHTQYDDTLIEPIAMLRLGRGKLRFNVSVGLSLLPIHSILVTGIAPYDMGVGVHYSL